ncbi:MULTISPECIES: hypothetical protein [unclassified Variovorax]|jgi:hypothetical protein|uniref:hypothetical protein n=1 Tax=unclassified Variovorax TaxID=663243 RepID=UPI00076D80BB|nr:MULTISPECIES: hypothetical protein [unclassified Variovorax]KWT97578.1 hypothetical protein APY03_1403 [Variovorax sp. WDL1]PNG55976.1 hypothetical protein CHC07_02389 [Variovorax sp. B4]PNG57400.1 hypothetical protein CHC06_02392 [Variovorax sp. B2]VTV10231.1 hypothetical protein WDL1CHR_01239 [Variovorax sp. WDL1]
MLDIDLPAPDQAIRSVLANRGIVPALALLNDRTNYRFSAIYKLDGEVMHAAHAFDRTSEYRTWLKVVPLGRSFCQYAMAHGEFVTRHASKDQRLTNRPYAGFVESYYGQLLTREDGTPYGTFIHFDLEPCDIAASEIAFLREVIPTFLDYLN